MYKFYASNKFQSYVQNRKGNGEKKNDCDNPKLCGIEGILDRKRAAENHWSLRLKSNFLKKRISVLLIPNDWKWVPMEISRAKVIWSLHHTNPDKRLEVRKKTPKNLVSNGIKIFYGCLCGCDLLSYNFNDIYHEDFSLKITSIVFFSHLDFLFIWGCWFTIVSEVEWKTQITWKCYFSSFSLSCYKNVFYRNFFFSNLIFWVISKYSMQNSCTKLYYIVNLALFERILTWAARIHI